MYVHINKYMYKDKYLNNLNNIGECIFINMLKIPRRFIGEILYKPLRVHDKIANMYQE